MAFLLHFSEEASGKLGEILSGVGRIRESGEIGGVSTRSLDLVLDASHRLMHTVAEILDVTELELGRARVDEELCSPIQLAVEVLDELRDSARSRGVELALEETTSVPETVCSEPTRIRQILRSLLKNAIQSIDSGSGSVTVTVSTAQPASWKRPQLRYEVTDTGVGIPKQRMGTLFEPFSREDELREQRGCGFGLALARRLAILLGGDLAARSEPGQGSSFTLTLNVGQVAARRKAA